MSYRRCRSYSVAVLQRKWSNSRRAVLFGKTPNNMGQVFFEDPVHHISGKISRKYRTCYNHKRINGLNFTNVHGERTTPVSADEMKRRERFKVVRLAARSRAMDLSKLTYDQIDFVEERKAKGTAFKYTTYKGWLFGKAWKCYNNATGQVTLSERLNIIG